MSVLTRQQIKTRIDNTLYANANNEITPLSINDLLKDILDSGYVVEDMFPVYTSAAGRIGDTFRYQFVGDAVPSLFLVAQNVANKPKPTPAAQPQYVRLTQPGGSNAAYVPLTGTSEKNPITGPLVLGQIDKADGSISLYNNANGDFYRLEAQDGLVCSFGKQEIFELFDWAGGWAVPLYAKSPSKPLYEEQWNKGHNLYVARHKLEELLGKLDQSGATRETKTLSEYAAAFFNGEPQENVGTVVIDDNDVAQWNSALQGIGELLLRTLDPGKERQLQYPLRLVNASKQAVRLLNSAPGVQSPLVLTSDVVTLTPGGSWIDFVWSPEGTGSSDGWYMTDARIYSVRRETKTYKDYMDAYWQGANQENVGTVVIDDDSLGMLGPEVGLPLRTLNPVQEKLLQYPLRLVNASSKDVIIPAHLISNNTGTYFVLTRKAITLTPGGSWIDFVWSLEGTGSSDGWYMTDACIYNSPSWY